MKIGPKTFKTDIEFSGIDFSIIYSWIRINKRLKYSDHAFKWLPILFLSWQKPTLTKTFHLVHYVHFFNINSGNFADYSAAIELCKKELRAQGSK